VSDTGGGGGAVQPPATGGGAPQRRDRSDQEKLIDELYFKRDLNEVHLLIDFVSGRPERSLDRLTMPGPGGATKTAAEIVERIASMRYPPDPDPVINAKNAAFLLIAKDHLSALASPARGLTIAYTEMFVGAGDGSSFGFLRRLGTLWRQRRPTTPGVGAAAPQEAPAPSPASRRDPRDAAASGSPQDQPPLPRDARIELAFQTFPALKTHAERFKRFHGFLVRFCLVWFALTALTYWDVSLGRSELQRLDQFWKERTETLQANPDLLNEALCPAYQDGNQELPKLKADDAAKADDAPKKVAVACRNLQYLDRARYQTREDLTRLFRCSERTWRSAPLHVWCWDWVLAAGVEPAGQRSEPALGSGGAGGASPTVPEAQASAPSGSAAPAPAANTGGTGPPPAGNSGRKTEPPDQVQWQSAESVLSVFTTYILPMMFGLLGTIIGAFRGIQARVRDSELAPRDYALTILGLPLGAVAGVAVGLFLSPSSVPTPGSGAVASALTLTTSGLGFLGGYGSQTFFRFIDELLGRVFPDSTARASGSQPVAGSSRP
jgi:hypothetical protein